MTDERIKSGIETSDLAAREAAEKEIQQFLAADANADIPVGVYTQRLLTCAVNEALDKAADKAMQNPLACIECCEWIANAIIALKTKE